MTKVNFNTDYYTKDKIINYKDITDIELHNVGSNNVIVNGKLIYPGGKYRFAQSLIINEVEIKIVFPIKNIPGNKLEFTYCQIAEESKETNCN
ncbi:MAG: hypothetical protein GXO49_04115 [Chlorobi bacterium]|nr:hypothetical protein [Chlorobiota bacterium]